MSIPGSPEVIHSAITFPTPMAWVIQTASAIQNPLASLDSPSNGPPSGVKENSPFIGRSISAPSRAGSILRASCQEDSRSEEHTSELQSRQYLVCRLLLEKKST